MTQSGPPIRPGDLVAGKYRIERVVGMGGMGVVVAARHEQLDQLVAIKFVRDDAIGSGNAVDRFLREARAAVKLRSEHAAKVLDVGKLESGAPYIVMEFLDGSDLAQVLAAGGPLPVEAAADCVLQACEAVAEAHAAGIVHRDLKPQNLFLARTVGGSPKVKVLDFGVSKSIHPTSGGRAELTRTRTMLGSPLYMSPEQMRSSRDVDPRSDVWALGVVLFELLTQRWPFEADTMPELCLKVVSDPPTSLASLRPDAPQALVDIVTRCLEKDPAKRYANAAELGAALEPLAPPVSRVLATRALLAIDAASRARGLTPTPAGSQPPISSGPSSPREAPTPSAWGSGRGGEALFPRGKPARLALGLGAGVVAVASVGASLLVLRGHFASQKGATSSMASSTSVIPAALPLSTAPALAEPTMPETSPAVVLVPSETTANTAQTETGATGSGSAKVPTVPPPAKPLNGVNPTTAAVHPSAGAKPAVRDDDIPTLR